MLVYNRADQPEGRMAIVVAVLVQAVEVREGAGRYYAQDATFLPQEPLHGILVC